MGKSNGVDRAFLWDWGGEEQKLKHRELGQDQAAPSPPLLTSAPAELGAVPKLGQDQGESSSPLSLPTETLQDTAGREEPDRSAPASPTGYSFTSQGKVECRTGKLHTAHKWN